MGEQEGRPEGNKKLKLLKLKLQSTPCEGTPSPVRDKNVTLILKQILHTSTTRNVWRTVENLDVDDQEFMC